MGNNDRNVINVEESKDGAIVLKNSGRFTKQHLMLFSVFIILILSVFCFSGCTTQQKSIKIAVTDWPEDKCMSELVKTVLEKEMNYKVEIVKMDIDSVFKSLAEGKCDFFLDGWLPNTHEKYIYEYGNKLDNLGYNFEGARIGLVVPSYVPIQSIIQLNEYQDKFDRTIVGIEPNSGIVRITEKAINDYKLDFKIIKSSNSEMIKKLEKAIEQKEWIVVTGWSPHWIFAKWDLTYLDDPSFVYGAPENIQTISRKDFSKDFPEISEFLYNFRLNKSQLEELLLNSNLPQENVEILTANWINANRALVDSWLGKNQ